MSAGDGPVELPLDALARLGRTAYVHAGMSDDDAALVVEVQLEADLRGVDTHGFQRLPWYVEHLEGGRNNPRPDVRVLRQTPSSVHLDGDNGLGQLVCVRLMERVVDKAVATGVGVGGVRNSNDWGCGAYYPLMAARAGLVAFATTTSGMPLTSPCRIVAVGTLRSASSSGVASWVCAVTRTASPDTRPESSTVPPVAGL